MLPHSMSTLPESSLSISNQNQLNILNARPGVVEASLLIEPYNGEHHIQVYSLAAHLTLRK